MEKVVVTDKTREKVVPPQVRGRKWMIDDKNYVAFDSYGSIEFAHEQRCAIQGRMTIADAKAVGAALLAAVSAYEGQDASVQGTPIKVEVVHWELEQATGNAERALARLNEALACAGLTKT